MEEYDRTKNYDAFNEARIQKDKIKQINSQIDGGDDSVSRTTTFEDRNDRTRREIDVLNKLYDTTAGRDLRSDLQDAEEAFNEAIDKYNKT